jgi:hypothetical protein
MAKGEIYRCQDDEKAVIAFDAFLIYPELLQILWETSKWELENNQKQH